MVNTLSTLTTIFYLCYTKMFKTVTTEWNFSLWCSRLSLFVKWAFTVGNTLVGSGSTLALSSTKDNINSVRLMGCSRYAVPNSAITHTFFQLRLELIRIFLISIAMNNVLSLNPLFPVRRSMQVVYNITKSTLPLGWGILLLEPDPSNGKECQGRLWIWCIFLRVWFWEEDYTYDLGMLLHLFVCSSARRFLCSIRPFFVLSSLCFFNLFILLMLSFTHCKYIR